MRGCPASRGRRKTGSACTRERWPEMATTSTAPALLAGGASLPASAGRAGFGGALRSEFTKIRSVRSTYWTLLALTVVCIGIGVLFSLGEPSHVQSLAGTRASAAVVADARQHGVALSVFGAVALVTGLITSFGSFFAGQAILATQNVGASIGQPGALRAVIGGGLFLTVCGLLSLGIGAVLRHTAGAITAAIGLLFVLFVLSGFLPSNWAADVDKWIPFNAGGAIWEQFSGQNMFHPWTGFAVFCGYAAVALIGGLVLFRKRDA